MNGNLTEWKDIELPVVVESTATLKLEILGLDEIPADFKLTLANKSVRYENVTVNQDGSLNLGTGKKLYRGTYTVTAENYDDVTVIVDATGEVTVYLTVCFVTDSNLDDFAESYINYTIDKTTGEKTVTIYAKEDGDLGACLETRHSEATWALTDAEKNAKSIIVEMTFKQISGDKGAADRAGIQMTSDHGGFVFWHNGRLDEIEKGHRAGLTLNQSPDNTGEYKTTSVESGWKLQIERNGTSVILRIWENNAWKQIMSGTCDENATNDIRLLGAHGTWEFSDIRVEIPQEA